MTKIKLNKKELNSIWIKTFWLQLGWNYERMSGIGYAHAMAPVLEKKYKDDPEKLAEMAKLHTEFYNTNPFVSPAIVGANIALEEEAEGDTAELTRSLKLSLMGPLASIGDTLLVAVFGTIVYAFAGTIALSGSQLAWIAALVPFLCFTLPLYFIRYKLFHVGHEMGASVFTTYADKFELFKKYGYRFGLIVIGGLAFSVVKVNFMPELWIGDVMIPLNDAINGIVPGLASLGLVLGSYWALGKKWMNSTRLLWIILVGGTILGALGVLV